jgi:hypothetical protein
MGKVEWPFDFHAVKDKITTRRREDSPAQICCDDALIRIHRIC